MLDVARAGFINGATKAPVLYVCIAFISGILVADSFYALPAWLWLIVTAVSVVGVVWHRREWLMIWLLLFSFAAGGTDHALRMPWRSAAGLQLVEDIRCDFECELLHQPRWSSKWGKCYARVHKYKVYGEDRWQSTSGRIQLMVSKDGTQTTLLKGEHVQVGGRLRRINESSDKNDWLARQCAHNYVSHRLWVRAADVEVCREAYSLSRTMAHWRGQLEDRLRFSGLSTDVAAIAQAMLLGDRSELTEMMQTQYRSAGVAHLLCVSGLHVGLVVLMIGWFLRPLRRWKSAVYAVTEITFVWAFVLLTGAAPSAVRAGVMFSLCLIGQELESSPNMINVISVSALLMLGCSPNLLWDVGFQLSYAAVIGIVLWQRPMSEWLSDIVSRGRGKFETEGDRSSPSSVNWMIKRVLGNTVSKIIGWVSLTISAQLATLPFAIFYFHRIYPYAVVTNVAVTPLVGLVMLGIVLVILSQGMGGIGGIVVWFTETLMELVNGVVSLVGEWRGAQVDAPFVSSGAACLIAAVVLAFGSAVRTRNLTRMLFAGTLLAVLVGTHIWMGRRL